MTTPVPPWQMPGMDSAAAPPPTYTSWADYCAVTTLAERRARCVKIAGRSNQKRLLSVAPTTRLTGRDVLAVLEDARGRCVHCGSLAVEGRPSNPTTGGPIRWGHVGRRIGSLEHIVSRFTGGTNDPTNLAWSCLWCNTWPQERRAGATDHGGYFPPE
ncbi:MAG TPA: hypothetical protein VG247_32985 [Pseudonocardiaceae bacterium]|jgi:hypothetical protein|nr:hypothetical protein [Pseudonocardiaceae bacterium]